MATSDLLAADMATTVDAKISIADPRHPRPVPVGITMVVVPLEDNGLIHCHPTLESPFRNGPLQIRIIIT